MKLGGQLMKHSVLEVGGEESLVEFSVSSIEGGNKMKIILVIIII